MSASCSRRTLPSIHQAENTLSCLSTTQLSAHSAKVEVCMFAAAATRPGGSVPKVILLLIRQMEKYAYV